MFNCALLVLLIVIVPPHGLRAQSTEDLDTYAARQRARIDSLIPLYNAATAAEEQLRRREAAEQARTYGRPDSVRVGPLTLVGLPREIAAGAPLFERAWREYQPLLGDAGARIDDVVFIIRGDVGEPVLRHLYSRPRHYLLDLPSNVRYRDGIRVVRATLGKSLRELLPVAVRDWIGDGNFGAGREMEHPYRELARGASAGARQCYQGDVRTCIGILGLADNDWLQYYSAVQRRQLVKQSRRRNLQVYRCVERRQDSACTNALTPPAGGDQIAAAPLTYHSRVVLLEHALRAGGPGSFDRLVADTTADVSRALSAAAGMDVAPLVASWRSEVLAARPNAAAGLGTSAFVALFWIALLVTLATRSTRWRIG